MASSGAPAGKKVCGKCGKTKALSGFHADPKSPDGKGGWCKVCRKAYNRERNAAKGMGTQRGRPKKDLPAGLDQLRPPDADELERLRAAMMDKATDGGDRQAAMWLLALAEKARAEAEPEPDDPRSRALTPEQVIKCMRGFWKLAEQNACPDCGKNAAVEASLQLLEDIRVMTPAQAAIRIGQVREDMSRGELMGVLANYADDLGLVDVGSRLREEAGE